MRIITIHGVRPRGVGYWRLAHDGSGIPAVRRHWLWALICEALNIPYRLVGRGNRMRLYVPPLYALRACKELTEAAAEGTTRRVVAALPAYNNAHYALLVFLTLMIWHGLRSHWWPALGLPGDLWPEQWVNAGALNVYRVVTNGEWERLFTALTLHADSEHLFSNMLFGVPFLVLLFRRIGVGPGLGLVVLAGALGNALNVWYRFGQGYTVSLGFSTALFGAVGALSGLMAAGVHTGDAHANRNVWQQRWRHSVVYLAAGLALLAFIGSGEADGTSPGAGRTDYAAHIFGLLSGVCLGALTGWSTERFTQQVTERSRRAAHWFGVLIGLATLGGVVGAWAVAVCR